MSPLSLRRRALVVTTAAVVSTMLWASPPASADVGTFGASQDNTLYEPGVGTLSNGGTFSNGSGDHFFAGRTGQDPSLSIRRALLEFDLASLPADATVNSATLTLRLSRSAQAGAATVSLHRALASWGESTSHAPGLEGEGTFAHAGDATWFHRFYDNQLWTSPGGDFHPVASATTTVGSSGSYYSWSGAQLAADVQNWINNPTDNFGWFLLGDETRERTAKRFDSRNHTTASRRPQLIIDYTLIASWASNGDGNWSEPVNWSTGSAPNGIGAAAKLGNIITEPRTVTLDVPVTLGSLRFDSPVSYTLAGTESLTLDATSGNAAVNVISGSHAISAPVALVDSTSFNIVQSNSVLTLSGPLSTSGGVSINKVGEGELRARSIRAQTLTIDAGRVKVLADGSPSATSVVSALTIAGGTSPTAQLDLTDNALVIDYASGNSPLPTIRAQVASGYNDAQWDGAGIICSGPGSGTTHGMGYAEASAVFSSFPATFAGQSVDDSSLLLIYTRYGDANLDGVVNLQDFNRLAANFGSADAVWSMGDFNYDGLVNLQDFNRLAGNFGLSASGPDGPTVDDWSTLAAAVPEPLGAAGIAVGWAMLSLHRRRGG